jgi:hypothetical protein
MAISKALRKLSLVAGLTSVLSVSGLAVQTAAQALAIISNGTIQLGVNREGHLNVGGGAPSSGTGTTTVGVRFVPTGAEATAPGCLCEGWGVADAISGVSGFANISSDGGARNLIVDLFTSDAESATSVVFAADRTFKVTHEYTPVAETPFLYRAKVTIENISAADTDVRYRRVMDWDVEPTAFSEFVTIQGTVGAANVLFASNNGFASANPLAGPSDIGFTGDFVDAGPLDHGALFDFGFGMLTAGASKSFDIFYGAAPNEFSALGALAAVSAEVYSLGQPDGGQASGEPNTFMFAFRGVGGTPIPEPNPIPTPALLPGLIGMGVAALRKRKSEAADAADNAEA